MRKNITFAIIILILIAGGISFWWQNGAELRELNKNLPEGIRVVERNGQQVVINKKEGYEIIVPDGWKELENVEYLGKESGLTVESKNTDDWASISVLNKEKNIDLALWIEKRIQDYPMRFTPLASILGEEKIGNYEIVKVKDEALVGTFYFYYFQKDSKIYEIYTDYSEESIKDIILNISF